MGPVQRYAVIGIALAAVTATGTVIFAQIVGKPALTLDVPAMTVTAGPVVSALSAAPAPAVMAPGGEVRNGPTTTPEAVTIAATGGQLRLDVSKKSGSLVIANGGSQPVTINRAIAVETEMDGAWSPLTTEFNAVASCVKSSDTKTTLVAGASMSVMPWRGFSCSGQCNETCRANIYYGAGPFRFVVTTADGTHVTSAKFRMPTEPGK